VNLTSEARRGFGNSEEGESPPLEAVTRNLVKTRESENSEVRALVNCGVIELAIGL
jgi:hypothetical protein